MVSPVPHDEGKPAKVEVLMNWKSGVFFLWDPNICRNFWSDGMWPCTVFILATCKVLKEHTTSKKQCIHVWSKCSTVSRKGTWLSDQRQRLGSGSSSSL